MKTTIDKTWQTGLLKRLRHDLDKERYMHTLGVAYTGASLAMNYGSDMQKAFLAGLLHDCAKCIPNDEKIALCRHYGLQVTSSEERNPFMLHAKLGACFADIKYDCKDPQVASAILYHTTGRPDMTMLEKIIFTADYIEPGRDRADHLEEIRMLAFRDIDGAVERICADTLLYLEKTSAEIDPATHETYIFYKERNNIKTENKCSI